MFFAPHVFKIKKKRVMRLGRGLTLVIPNTNIVRPKIPRLDTILMVGPRDGGFGFDGGKKYSDLENTEAICVQCQAGQHAKCLAKSDDKISCDCELCLIG